MSDRVLQYTLINRVTSEVFFSDFRKESEVALSNQGFFVLGYDFRWVLSCLVESPFQPPYPIDLIM